jgi:hypothetical protein
MARFGEEDIRLELKSLGPFARGNRGSKHRYRGPIEERPPANLFQHVETAESGYVEIEDNQVGLPLVHLGVFDIAHGRSAIGAHVHLEADAIGAQSFLYQDYVWKVIVSHHDPESSSGVSVVRFHGQARKSFPG